MKWLAHFGLNASAFSKEIGDAELWVPSSRRRLVDELDVFQRVGVSGRT